MSASARGKSTLRAPEESSIAAVSVANVPKPKYDFQKLFEQLLEPEPQLPVATKLTWVRTNDDRLMDWIQTKIRPIVLAGFELETCYQQLKQAVERLPRVKPIPPQRDPKVPVFQYTKKPEAGLDLSAPSLAVVPAPRPPPHKGVVEEAVNKFVTSHEAPRFSFHAKQRFGDIKGLVGTLNGKGLREAVVRMPEKESEETYIPPEPAFAGIPLRAFENEGFIFQKLEGLSTTESAQKPDFVTKFYIPDLKTMKAVIAKHQSSEGGDPYKPVSDHKFRDEDKPSDYNKPEFKLRVQSEPPPQLLLYGAAESDVQVKARNKSDIKRLEEEEKMKRTVISGKVRSEWGIANHVAPKTVQFASSQPHALLDKELYIDPFYVMARSYNF